MVRLQWDKLWSHALQDPINCLLVGKPFLEELSEENDVLIGTTAGRVLILNQSKPAEVLLETKGGSIQALRLYDLTGQRALDLVVGDSDGVITMFSRQQILSKQILGTAVNQIEIHNDLSDLNGTLTSFQPHDVFWKLNVSEESAMMATLAMKGRRSPAIHCVLATTIKDTFGRDMSCLLVTDNWPFVHFVQSGHCVMTLRTPTPIRSMTAGHFLNNATVERLSNPTTSRARREDANHVDHTSEQILLAGDDGGVYILLNYEIHLWFKTGFSLHKIMSFRPKHLAREEPDLILITGQANVVQIYQNGEMLGQIETEDWPHSMTVGDVNADGKDELVLGLLDQTVHVYSLECTV